MQHKLVKEHHCIDGAAVAVKAHEPEMAFVCAYTEYMNENIFTLFLAEVKG